MILELKENRVHGTKDYPYEQFYMKDIHHAFQFPVHWHDEVEIIYIETGQLHVKIEEEEFDGYAGDLYFVNPRELHLMSSDSGEVTYYTLLFPLEFLSFQTLDALEEKLLSPIRRNQLMFPRQLKDSSVKKQIGSILNSVIEKNQNILPEYLGKHFGFDAVQDLSTRIMLLQVLQILREYNLFYVSSKRATSNMQRELLAYIHAHYTEHLSLSQLSEEFHLSEKYLSHYFVEHFHLPFSNYVIHLRLTKAKQLLESTDLSITDIALFVGFPNISHFIRSFKSAYNVSPLQYRKALLSPNS